MSWAMGGLLANATGGFAQGMLLKKQWDREDEKMKLEKEAAERANRGLDLQERRYNEVEKPNADRAAELFPMQKEHQELLLETEKKYGIPAKKLEALSKFTGTLLTVLDQYGVEGGMKFYNDNKGMFGDIGMPDLKPENFKQMADKQGWEIKLDDGNLVRYNSKTGEVSVKQVYEPATVKAARIKAGADITTARIAAGGNKDGKLTYKDVKERISALKSGISTSLAESKGILSRYGKSGGGYEQALSALGTDDAAGAGEALAALMTDLESAYQSAQKKAEKGDLEAKSDLKRLQALATRVSGFNDDIAKVIGDMNGGSGSSGGTKPADLVYVPGKGFVKP